jgi:hypothetical protein
MIMKNLGLPIPDAMKNGDKIVMRMMKPRLPLTRCKGQCRLKVQRLATRDCLTIYRLLSTCNHLAAVPDTQ